VDGWLVYCRGFNVPTTSLYLYKVVSNFTRIPSSSVCRDFIVSHLDPLLSNPRGSKSTVPKRPEGQRANFSLAISQRENVDFCRMIYKTAKVKKKLYIREKKSTFLSPGFVQCFLLVKSLKSL
jgi:hypothetical protein